MPAKFFPTLGGLFCGHLKEHTSYCDRNLLREVLTSFCFVSDVRKQAEMAHLTKERDHLIDSIRTYRSLFDTTRQLINEMQGEYSSQKISERRLNCSSNGHH